jgi:hypothetical protein
MEKPITRKLTGSSGSFWRKVDQVSKEVAAWPSWKRRHEAEALRLDSRLAKAVKTPSQMKVARKKAR